MKNLFKFEMLLAVAVMVCVSCSADRTDAVPESLGGTVKISFTPDNDGDADLSASAPQTRTEFGDGYAIKWIESTDRIGVYVASALPTTNAEAVARRETAGSAIRFEAEVQTFGAGSTLYAYYPYTAENTAVPGSVELTIPAAQQQPAPGRFDGSSNPLVAVPTLLATDQDGTITEPVRFRQLGAMAEFDIFDESADAAHAGEIIRLVGFVATDGKTPAGSFTYDLTSVPETGDPAAVTATTGSALVTVSLPADCGAAVGAVQQEHILYMTVIPGTYTGDLMVATDRATYVFSNRQVEFLRAHVRRFKVALDRADRIIPNILTVADWNAFVTAANSTDGDYSQWVDPLSGAVNLGADLSAVQFSRIQKDWNGTFNGNGHTMSQSASSVPLFTVIGEQGVVENLNLAGSLSSVQYPTGTGSASVARINYGVIRNVVNDIDITLNNVNAGYIIAGMVVCNAGTMENCEQRGDISVSYAVTEDINTYVGGIACFASAGTDPVGAEACVGTFVKCRNTGNISIDKSGTGTVSLGKFAVGGICAIVHDGTADNYSVFDGCENSGYIYRRDDQTGSNTAACLGGIVGRVCHYTAAGKALDMNSGYYVRIVGCRNTGTVENNSYQTQGLANALNTGARLGFAGGIVGVVLGLQDKNAEITDCVNTGTIRGGHAVKSAVLGGIVGMSGNAKIEGSVSDGSFFDPAQTTSSALDIGAIGGLVGYVRFDTSIDGCSAYADVNVTSVFKVGLCTGGVYAPAANVPTATIVNSKFGGNLAFSGNEIAITATNFSSRLAGFGATSVDNNSFWSDRP